MKEWISRKEVNMDWTCVEDDLPRHLSTVVVFCRPIDDPKYWDVAGFFEVTAYNDQINEWCMKPKHPHKITHWMPLHEPPKTNLNE